MIVYYTPISTFNQFEFNDHSLPLVKFLEPVETSTLIMNIPLEGLNKASNFKYCPALKNQIRNSYTLRFPFDYHLEIKDNNIFSNMYDQQFFDQVVNIRSLEHKLLGLRIFYLFISEDSLEMEVTGSYLGDNDFVNKTIVIPGQFNIGKWTRNLELSFLLKNNINEIKINKGDPYLNVKFLTDEHVNLKKFYPTDQLLKIIKQNLNVPKYKIKLVEPLQYYYDLYKQSKMHNAVIREIKNNLLD